MTEYQVNNQMNNDLGRISRRFKVGPKKALRIYDDNAARAYALREMIDESDKYKKILGVPTEELAIDDGLLRVLEIRGVPRTSEIIRELRTQQKLRNNTFLPESKEEGEAMLKLLQNRPSYHYEGPIYQN